MLAQHIGLHVNICHSILKLIAEPIGTTGLIKPSAPPEASREGLIQEPTIEQNVHRRIGSLDVGLVKDHIPEFREVIPGNLHVLDIPILSNNAFCIGTVRAVPPLGAAPRNDSFLRSLGARRTT